MENLICFQVRIDVHQQQVARINAEDWKQEPVAGLLDHLRAVLAKPNVPEPGRPSPAVRMAGGAAAPRPL